MAAELAGRPALVDALTPDKLEMIGRALIRIGEVIFLMDTTGGRLHAVASGNPWDVTGGAKP